MMTNTYLMAATGGAIFGSAAVLLLWLNGRIAGISGIFNGMFTLRLSESGWRIAFVAGLVLGGFVYSQVSGQALITRSDFPLIMTIAGGLLVGFGTRLGSGCTSGHGICGISRLSLRSLIATLLFVATGMVVASGIHWLMP